MSAFLSHIIHRHAQVENTVQPRPRSLFEPPPAAPDPGPPAWLPATADPVAPPLSETLLPPSDDPPTREDRTAPATQQPPANPPAFGQYEKNKHRPAGSDKRPPMQRPQPVKRAHSRPARPSPTHRPPVLQEHSEPIQLRMIQEEATPIVQKVRELSAKTVEQAARPHRIAVAGKGPAQNDLYGKALSPKRIEPARQPEPMPPPEAPPTVKIHIGRIEIRAVQEKPEKPPRTTGAPKPKLSLDQFLNDREG